mmetsp:Transcript_13197/g.27380  ORF Transcript_13197/g.27380 Transcript_13197/m.27380 type:complete len:267 (-) Transcript_13197:4-804(-)
MRIGSIFQMFIGTVIVNSVSNGLPFLGGSQFLFHPIGLMRWFFTETTVQPFGRSQSGTIIRSRILVFTHGLGVIGHGRDIFRRQFGPRLVQIKFFIVRVNAPLTWIPSFTAGFEIASTKHEATGTFLFAVIVTLTILVLTTIPSIAPTPERRSLGGFFFGQGIAVNIKHHSLGGIFFGLLSVPESHAFFVHLTSLFIFDIQGIVRRQLHPPLRNLRLVALGTALLLGRLLLVSVRGSHDCNYREKSATRVYRTGSKYTRVIVCWIW